MLHHFINDASTMILRELVESSMDIGAVWRFMMEAWEFGTRVGTPDGTKHLLGSTALTRKEESEGLPVFLWNGYRDEAVAGSLAKIVVGRVIGFLLISLTGRSI